MRIAHAILLPLLLLGGCATTGAGPHAHGAQGQAKRSTCSRFAPTDRVRSSHITLRALERNQIASSHKRAA